MQFVYENYMQQKTFFKITLRLDNERLSKINFIVSDGSAYEQPKLYSPSLPCVTV
jgi:hypothetical protein